MMTYEARRKAFSDETKKLLREQFEDFLADDSIIEQVDVQNEPRRMDIDGQVYLEADRTVTFSVRYTKGL